MVNVEMATIKDRAEVERLVAAYHRAEGLDPNPARIAWVVDEQLRGRFPGLLLLAREEGRVVGVAVAIVQPSAELGRVLQINDFFVEPDLRRKGVGRALATRLLRDASAMGIDLVTLEVLPSNDAAAAFWQSVGFSTEGRTVYSRAPWIRKDRVRGRQRRRCSMIR